MSAEASKALFISDLHLRSSDEPNADLLLQFLNSVGLRGYTHLFLLGDIFDLWIADHAYFENRFRPILDKLSELQNQGVEIHYFEGNHDLDLRPYFEKKLGATVHEQAFVTKLAGRTLRLEHGDQMDPTDRDYLFLRWLLRTPVVRWLGRHLPESIVRWIGENASHTSRRYTNGVRKSLGFEAVESKQLAHAQKVYAKTPFDFLIAGHVHVKLEKTLAGSDARLINLGTWLEEPLVFELTESVHRLLPVPEFISSFRADSRREIERPT
jgi:UDP-2,3-diacylglucosamine hydrolase